MKSLIKTLIMVSLAAGSAAAQAQRLELAGITHAGSGCPAGSVELSLGEYRDSVALRLFGADFVAEAGPGLSLSAGRKSCQILADLRIEQGWQYRVLGVAYAGEAYLTSGASAQIKTSYYFQGQLATASETRSIMTPGYTRMYDMADFSSQEVWSPCGVQRALNLKISAFVRSSRGHSMLALDDPLGIDPSFILIETRPCSVR